MIHVILDYYMDDHPVAQIARLEAENTNPELREALQELAEACLAEVSDDGTYRHGPRSFERLTAAERAVKAVAGYLEN